MTFLRSMMTFLKGGTPVFLPLEAAILEETARQLGGQRAAALRFRISRINHVARLDGGREVNSYALKKGKPSFDEGERIVPEDDEKELARFTFIIPECGKFKGVIWLVNGHFFSMEFNKPTEHILDDVPCDLELILCI